MRKVIIIVAALCLGSGAYAKNIAKELRVGVQPDGVSRIVLETTESPNHKTTYLHSPARIILDVSDLDASKLVQDDVAKGHIKDVKMGEQGASKRFVIELAEPAELAKPPFILKTQDGKGHRLVLDIKKVSAARFAELAGVRLPKATPDILNASAPPPQTQTPFTNKRKIIVIDAGHGGQDPGTIGKNGTKEKDIVLAAAKELAAILSQNKTYEVILTRDKDVFIPLRDRAQIGEKLGASLFVSIHADSSPRKEAKGFSVYTLNEKATDEESKNIALKENASDLLGVNGFESYEPNIKNILGDLSQSIARQTSYEFADTVVREIRRETVCIDNPHREAPFTVLRSTIPSVLSEIGFLSNVEEEKKLRDPAHRQKIARGLARAIDGMLKE